MAKIIVSENILNEDHDIHTFLKSYGFEQTTPKSSHYAMTYKHKNGHELSFVAGSDEWRLHKGIKVYHDGRGGKSELKNVLSKFDFNK